MPTLNLNNADKIYYGNTEAEKLYKGSQLLFPQSTFDLLSLSPVMWFDSDDATTFTLVSNAVSEWRDKSGNNRHLSQATSTKRPILSTIGGKITVSFDGVDDVLFNNYSINGLTNVSIFIVASKPTTSNKLILSTQYSTDPTKRGVMVSIYDTFALVDGRPQGGAYISNQMSLIPNELDLIYAQITNSGILVGANGSLNSSPTSYSVSTIVSGTRFLIGANDGISTLGLYSDTRITDVVVFDSVLSESNRQKVEGYLAWKRGLVNSLPSGHPYKNSQP